MYVGLFWATLVGVDLCLGGGWGGRLHPVVVFVRNAYMRNGGFFF